MNTDLSKKTAAIRECWTSQEKKARAELAQTIRLQLRALVVLSELASQGKNKKDNHTQVTANAC